MLARRDERASVRERGGHDLVRVGEESTTDDRQVGGKAAVLKNRVEHGQVVGHSGGEVVRAEGRSEILQASAASHGHEIAADDGPRPVGAGEVKHGMIAGSD